MYTMSDLETRNAVRSKHETGPSHFDCYRKTFPCSYAFLKRSPTIFMPIVTTYDFRLEQTSPDLDAQMRAKRVRKTVILVVKRKPIAHSESPSVCGSLHFVAVLGLPQACTVTLRQYSDQTLGRRTTGSSIKPFFRFSNVGVVG